MSPASIVSPLLPKIDAGDIDRPDAVGSIDTALVDRGRSTFTVDANSIDRDAARSTRDGIRYQHRRRPHRFRVRSRPS
jgi:hypothetical protein